MLVLGVKVYCAPPEVTATGTGIMFSILVGGPGGVSADALMSGRYVMLGKAWYVAVSGAARARGIGCHGLVAA